MLTEELIEKFQILYKKHYDLDISQEQAIENGEALVGFIKEIYQPNTNEDNDE